MLVVSDTSVVLNLAVVGEAKLLQTLFAEVVAPTAVRNEFNRLRRTEARFQPAVWPSWIQVNDPATMLPALTPWGHRLHTGERAAISVAVELQADLILIDEDAGRAAERSVGLKPTGVAGILLQAKAAGLIPAVGPLLDRIMNEANFWFGSVLRREVLGLAGESAAPRTRSPVPRGFPRIA